MGDKIVHCDFCEKISKMLENNIESFNGLKIINYKDIFTIREGIAICRGHNLCKIHTRTIKKDNKIRISKGEDIPNSLDVVKKIFRSDI